MNITKREEATLTLYHQPNANTVVEPLFFETLKEHFPKARIVEVNYKIDPKYLDCFVDTTQLISYLRVDNLLSKPSRNRFIKILEDFPPKLKVALSSSRVSFDFVIVVNDHPYYWELHEDQHRKLSISSTEKVFTPDGEELNVPRGLQRLIRDVWRVQYFRPYTIVWADWFIANRQIYEPSLSDGLIELHNAGKFSFRNFYEL